MATQEYIDDLIIVIETAEDAESVTNQMVAAVLGFLNEHLKLVSQGKEVEAEETARIAADAALQKAIDAVSLRIDRLVGNNASQAIDNFNEILNFLNGLKDSDSLAALLADINARIGSEDGSESEDGSLWGKLKSLSQDITSCSDDISTLQIDRDKMKQGLQETDGRLSSTFTNVNNLLNAGTVYSDLSGVFATLKTAGKINNVRKNGVILSFLTADGWVTKQFRGNPDTDFENVEKWEDFGSGGSAGGNTYNVTGNIPLAEGFYTLLSVRPVLAGSAGRVRPGRRPPWPDGANDRAASSRPDIGDWPDWHWPPRENPAADHGAGSWRCGEIRVHPCPCPLAGFFCSIASLIWLRARNNLVMTVFLLRPSISAISSPLNPPTTCSSRGSWYSSGRRPIWRRSHSCSISCSLCRASG